MTLTIQRVTPDDWRSHRDLRLEMLRDAPDAFFTQYDDVVGFDEDTWRERIATQFHFQARLDDDPVGSVGMWDDPETPSDASTLVAMYVAPRARGTGTGERLVQAVLDEAAARGRSRVVLEVTETNAPARRLYERMGFAYDGTRHPLPRREHLDELGMEKVLETPVPERHTDVAG
ncbi:MAG TPA: GNAT family N-acetyltransferase [Lapillicoccus sp.]|nr:GNAT family N-acetyltransferase [Lapillicoccus sp.]